MTEQVLNEITKQSIKKSAMMNEKENELQKQIEHLQQEQIIEMKEHQEAMLIADKRIKEFEAKLAEKDEEIKNLVLSHFESETNKAVLTTTQMINQVKISFAVEQLEKVKEFCEANCSKSNDIETGAYCGKVIGLDKILYKGDMSLYDYIDNQIKQLKEQN